MKESLSAADAWLSHYPVRHHAMIHGWFAHAVRQGAGTPSEVLHKVTVLLGQKLAWSVTPSSRNLCANVLEGLRCNRPGALAFASGIMQETS